MDTICLCALVTMNLKGICPQSSGGSAASTPPGFAVSPKEQGGMSDRYVHTWSFTRLMEEGPEARGPGRVDGVALEGEGLPRRERAHAPGPLHGFLAGLSAPPLQPACHPPYREGAF